MFPAARSAAGFRLCVLAFFAASLGAGMTGCATSNSWSKEGTPPDRISQDLSICRQNIPRSIARDNAIESDIMATRSTDLQKLDMLRIVRESDEGRDRDITETIIQQCMMSKGYSRGSTR